MKDYRQFVDELIAAGTRIESGESESEEVLFPFGEAVLRMDRQADGTIVSTSPDASQDFHSVSYPASPTRMPSYPDDLPFLNGVRASVMHTPAWGRRVVSWRNADQVEARVADLVAQLAEDGWRQVRRRAILFGLLGRKLEFVRGDQVRVINVQWRLGRPDSLNLLERDLHAHATRRRRPVKETR